MGDEKRRNNKGRDKATLGQIYDDIYGRENNAKRSKFIEENLVRFRRITMELAEEYDSSSSTNKYSLYMDLRKYFDNQKELSQKPNPVKLALLMLAVSAVSCFGSVWAQGQFFTLNVGLPFSPIGFGVLSVGLAVNLLVLGPTLKKSLGEFSRNKFRAFALGLFGTMVGITVGFPRLFGVEGLASAPSSLQILGSASLAIGFAIPLIAGFVMVCRAGWKRYQANKVEAHSDKMHENVVDQTENDIVYPDKNAVSAALAVSSALKKHRANNDGRDQEIKPSEPASTRISRYNDNSFPKYPKKNDMDFLLGRQPEDDDEDEVDEEAFEKLARSKGTDKPMIDNTKPDSDTESIHESKDMSTSSYSAISQNLQPYEEQQQLENKRSATSAPQPEKQSTSANIASIISPYVPSFVSSTASYVWSMLPSFSTIKGPSSSTSSESTNSSNNNSTMP